MFNAHLSSEQRERERESMMTKETRMKNTTVSRGRKKSIGFLLEERERHRREERKVGRYRIHIHINIWIC